MDDSNRLRSVSGVLLSISSEGLSYFSSRVQQDILLLSGQSDGITTPSSAELLTNWFPSALHLELSTLLLLGLPSLLLLPYFPLLTRSMFLFRFPIP